MRAYDRKKGVKFLLFARLDFLKRIYFLIVFHISGVFTAAFDSQLEWLIVKGIADFADGEQATAESWEACASMIAASLVSHILSDPCVFRTWPHYSGINSCQFGV